MFTAEEGRRAQQQWKAEAERHAAQRQASLDRQRIDNDPDTRKQIGVLARKLIDARPQDTVGIVIDVSVPRMLPFTQPKYARAEVYRAWPIGSQPWSDYRGETPRWEPTAITCDGRFVKVSSESPSVEFSPSLRWTDPSKPYLAGGPTGRPPYTSLLQVLEREWEETAQAGTGASPRAQAPRAPVQGRALSQREYDRCERLRLRIVKLERKNKALISWYGSPDNPKEHGPQRRAARKGFAELRRKEAEIRCLQQRIDRIKGLT